MRVNNESVTMVVCVNRKYRANVNVNCSCRVSGERTSGMRRRHSKTQDSRVKRHFSCAINHI